MNFQASIKVGSNTYLRWFGSLQSGFLDGARFYLVNHEYVTREPLDTGTIGVLALNPDVVLTVITEPVGHVKPVVHEAAKPAEPVKPVVHEAAKPAETTTAKSAEPVKPAATTTTVPPKK